MASYAAYTDVEAGFRPLDTDERAKCTALITEASLIVDTYNASATADAKKGVVCRMVRRALGAGADESFAAPIGATQGSISALGYSQSWTVGNGASGELYLERLEKKLLGAGDKIGSYSPVERLVHHA